MRIKYYEFLQIMHYINGDSELVSNIAGCETITELRELIKDTPAAFKIAGYDLDDVEKRVDFRFENVSNILAFNGSNKDYTPSKSNYDYCMDDAKFYSTFDKTVGRWVAWEPNFDTYRTKGNIGWLSNDLFNPANIKRIGGVINGEIDLSFQKHNDEDMLNFVGGSQIDLFVKTISSSDEISYYYDMTLYDNEIESEKGYYYLTVGSAEYGDNFYTNFDSRSYFFNVPEFVFSTNEEMGNLNIRGLFKSNIWLFKNENDLDNYLRTGDSSSAINNYVEPVEDITSKVFYYDYKLYHTNSTTHEKERIDAEKTAFFKIPNKTDKVAFVKKVNTFNSYALECTSDIVLTRNLNTGLYDIETPFSDVYALIFKGQDNFGLQLGDINTNIQFVDKLEDANYDNEENIKPSYNGTDAGMNLTTISTLGAFVKPYYVTADELNSIAGILYANDTDLITALKEGLWMYSGNPIDSVVDVCFYPIDLSIFSTHVRAIRLKFGSFVYTGQIQSIAQTEYNCIFETNNSFVMVNQRIIPIYNDFRDITNVSYQLFLPYYGLIELDNVVVNKTLRVEVKFDVYTSQLKYYIFIDNALFSAFECAIGRHMSVIGTDWISKSSKNIDSYINATTSATEAVVGAVTLNAGSVVGGVVGALQSYKDYNQKPAVQMAGNSTSGLNIYDPLSCYLITQQYESIKPANLKIQYGIPCYKIVTIGSCKGFTEITDVKLKTRALKTEIDEILSLLKNGVII